MGVRGLSSYVRNDPRNFSPLILHDTYIVVDGFNLINYLYINSPLYTQFNGEYLAFDVIVENFITNLRKCRVEPIFVFDGVHNTSKLSTLLRRNRDRLVTCSQLQKNASSTKDGTSADYRIAMQPPETSLCFVATLARLEVRQLTTDREADQLAASLAIHLGCPVVSNDSDFLILGPYWQPVSGFSYVPIDYFNFEPCAFPNPVCNACLQKSDYGPGGRSPCFYLEVQQFSPESILFKNLSPLQRPLFAVLCGNDVIPLGYFNNHLPGAPNQQQARPTGQAASKMAVQSRNADKFRRLIEWLSGFGSDVKQPVERILSKFPLAQRPEASRLLLTGLRSYAIDSVSNSPILTNYLDYLFPPSNGNPVNIISSNTGPNEVNRPVRPQTTVSGNQSVGDAALSALTEASQVQEAPLMFNWPQSLVHAFRRRNFAPTLCDSLYSNGYVLGPVVEDYFNREAYHLCASPIRHLIYGLLLQLEASASPGLPLSHLPGLQGSLHRPYVSEYTRVHASRLEHRRIGITFLSLQSSTSNADPRYTFLSENLGLPGNRTDTPSWMHGLICLYFLWMRSNKQSEASLSTSSTGLALTLCSLVTLKLLDALSNRSTFGKTRSTFKLHNKLAKHYAHCAAFITSKSSRTKPLQFHFLHAIAQTQAIHYTLDSLSGLLDAMADLPGEPRPTCIDLPPPQFCFPSGYLAHQLAAHLSRLSPALRIKEAVDYWIPCLLGQRLTDSVGPETCCAIPEPTPDFVSEVTEAYKVLVRTVDDMLVTAPPLREPAIPAQPAKPETIHRHQKAPKSPPRQCRRVAHRRAVAAPSHPSPAEVEALVTKAMREAGLTAD
ncbi:hypothetical protein AAHC03_016495 [Spirometra sp. Aus1]